MSTSYGGTPTTTESPSPDGRPSIGELLANVTQDLSTLIRQEVDLAKAEVKQSASKAGKGAGMFAGAGYAGHMTILFLSVALWWGLGTKTGYGWSALVVAGIWLIVGAALALVGRKEIQSIKGVPQTAATVKKIPDAIKGNEETA